MEFNPQIPEHWKGYTFKVNFRGQILEAAVSQSGNTFRLSGDNPLTIVVNGEEIIVMPTD